MAALSFLNKYKKQSLAQAGIAALFIGLFLYALWTGGNSFWTDSEMWAVVSVRNMFSHSGSYASGVKPLFDLLLYLCFRVAAWLDIHPMLVARGLSTLNAAFVALLFFLLVKKITLNHTIAFLLLLLTVSNSFFIKRAAHVRSDLFVTTFLLILCLIFESQAWKRWPPYLRLLTAAALTAVAMTLTPKAILPFALWTLAFAWSDLRPLLRGRSGLILLGLGLWALVAYISLNWASLRFFVVSFQQDSAGDYFSLYRLQHVRRFIFENGPIVAIFIYNFYYGVLKRTGAMRPYFKFANLLLLELAVYPDRLPFFIAALIPFWILPLACFPQLVHAPTPRLRRIFAAIPYLTLLYGFANLALWSYFIANYHSSDRQQDAVAWLKDNDRQLEGLLIYDPVGLRPFSDSANWFVGPGELWNSAILKLLQDRPPDVIFYTQRLLLLGDGLDKLLRDHYWSDGLGVFIRRRPFPTGTTELSCASLKSFVLQNWPEAPRFPDHIYFLNAMNNDGQELEVPGSEVWYETARGFHWGEIDKCKSLHAPDDLFTLDVLPARLVNSHSIDLINSFRFDPEY